MASDLIPPHLVEQLQRRIFDEALFELVVKKIGRSGLRLTPYRIARVKRWIANGFPDGFSFRSSLNIKLKIALTERDSRRLVGIARKQANDALHRVIVEASRGTVMPLYRVLRKKWPAQSELEERDTAAFEKRLLKVWKRPLASLAMLLTIAREIGEEVNGEARGNVSNRSVSKVEALTRLHGRACQIASETLVLLKSGYADGAMARWRSLHEIAVTMLILQDRPNSASEAYLNHRYVDGWKAAKEYKASADKMGYAKLTNEEFDELVNAKDRMLRRYGPYFEGEFGWASASLGKKKLTFRDLEKIASLEHWRSEYKLASQNVHAGPRSAFFRLGSGSEEILLAGASNIGLDGPGTNAAISLLQATSAVLQLAPTVERMCSVNVMAKLAEDIGLEFKSVRESEARKHGPSAEPTS